MYFQSADYFVKSKFLEESQKLRMLVFLKEMGIEMKKV